MKNEEKLDPLQKIRRDISALVIDIDTLLDERDKIPLDAVGAEAVNKKYRNQNTTENKLSELKYEIDKFAQEITSMKKNKSKNKSNYNISLLEEQLKNFGEQYEERRVDNIFYCFAVVNDNDTSKNYIFRFICVNNIKFDRLD